MWFRRKVSWPILSAKIRLFRSWVEIRTGLWGESVYTWPYYVWLFSSGAASCRHSVRLRFARVSMDRSYSVAFIVFSRARSISWVAAVSARVRTSGLLGCDPASLSKRFFASQVSSAWSVWWCRVWLCGILIKTISMSWRSYFVASSRTESCRVVFCRESSFFLALVVYDRVWTYSVWSIVFLKASIYDIW